MKLCKRDLSAVLELRQRIRRPLIGCVVLTPSLTGVAPAEGKFTDVEDGMFDLSELLLSHRGVLPVPTIVTGPEVGYGLGLGLLYFTMLKKLAPSFQWPANEKPLDPRMPARRFAGDVLSDHTGKPGSVLRPSRHASQHGRRWHWVYDRLRGG